MLEIIWSEVADIEAQAGARLEFINENKVSIMIIQGGQQCQN